MAAETPKRKKTPAPQPRQAPHGPAQAPHGPAEGQHCGHSHAAKNSAAGLVSPLKEVIKIQHS